MSTVNVMMMMMMFNVVQVVVANFHSQPPAIVITHKLHPAWGLGP